MKKIFLEKIKSAVESVVTTTSPTVQVGEVVAHGDHFQSPYRGRHEIFYTASASPKKLPEGAVRAASSKYQIIVGSDEPPTPEPTSSHYVGEWVGGEVPRSLVEPIYELAREMGLCPKDPQGVLVPAWVLVPKLAGWHYHLPVFWAAGKENSPAVIDGEVIAQQGHLLIVKPSDLPPVFERIREWNCTGDVEKFLNHVASRKEKYEEPVDGMASPVAVYWKEKPHPYWQDSDYHFAVPVSGPVHIYSPDHGSIHLDEGHYIALHRRPCKRID